MPEKNAIETRGQFLTGTMFVGTEEKFNSLKDYYEWYETVPKETYEKKDQPIFRLKEGQLTEYIFLQQMKKNGWVAESDEELMNAVWSAFDEYQAPYLMNRKAPQLQCLMADLIYFKADTYEAREKFLNLFSEAIDTLKGKQDFYSANRFRLKEAIRHAREAVKNNEELQEDIAAHPLLEKEKEKVEKERNRVKGPVVVKPLFSYSEDFVLERARKSGSRTPLEQEIIRKMYRGALKENAPQDLQGFMYPEFITDKYAEEDFPKNRTEFRMYLRSIANYLYTYNLYTRPGYAEFLRVAQPYLDAYKDVDARYLDKAYILNQTDLENWYRYGADRPQLTEEYLGEDGLKNFLEQTKKNGWIRRGDEELLTDFYKKAMKMEGDVGNRAKAVLARLTNTIVTDDFNSNRLQMLNSMGVIIDWAYGSRTCDRRFLHGREYRLDYKFTGTNSLTIEESMESQTLIHKAKYAPWAPSSEEEKLLEKKQVVLDKTKGEEREIKSRYFDEKAKLYDEQNAEKNAFEKNAWADRESLMKAIEAEFLAKNGYRFRSVVDLYDWIERAGENPYVFGPELEGENGVNVFLQKIKENGWKNPEDQELMKNVFLKLRDCGEAGSDTEKMGRLVLAVIAGTSVENEEMRHAMAGLADDALSLAYYWQGENSLLGDRSFSMEGIMAEADETVEKMVDDLRKIYFETDWNTRVISAHSWEVQNELRELLENQLEGRFKTAEKQRKEMEERHQRRLTELAAREKEELGKLYDRVKQEKKAESDKIRAFEEKESMRRREEKRVLISGQKAPVQAADDVKEGENRIHEAEVIQIPENDPFAAKQAELEKQLEEQRKVQEEQKYEETLNSLGVKVGTEAIFSALGELEAEEQRKAELEEKAEQERLAKIVEEKNRHKEVTADTGFEDYLEKAYFQGFVKETDRAFLKSSVLAYTNLAKDSEYSEEEKKALSGALSDLISAPMDDPKVRDEAVEKLRAALDTEHFKKNTQCRRALVNIAKWQRDVMKREVSIPEFVSEKKPEEPKPYKFAVEANFPDKEEDFLKLLADNGWNSEQDRNLLTCMFDLYKSCRDRVLVFNNTEKQYVGMVEDLRSCFNHMVKEPATDRKVRTEMVANLSSAIDGVESKFFPNRYKSAEKALQEWERIAEEERKFNEDKLFAGEKKAFLDEAYGNGWPVVKEETRPLLVRLLKAYNLMEDKADQEGKEGEICNTFIKAMTPVMNQIAKRPAGTAKDMDKLLAKAGEICDQAYLATNNYETFKALEESRNAIHVFRKNALSVTLEELSLRENPPVKPVEKKPEKPVWVAPAPKTEIKFPAKKEDFISLAVKNGWDNGKEERRVLKNMYVFYKAVHQDIENGLNASAHRLELRERLIKILNDVSTVSAQGPILRDLYMTSAAELSNGIMGPREPMARQLRDAVKARKPFYDDIREKNRLAKEAERKAEEDRIEKERLERQAKIAVERRLAEEQRQKEAEEYRKAEAQRKKEALEKLLLEEKAREEKIKELKQDSTIPTPVEKPEGYGLEHMDAIDRFESPLNYIKWIRTVTDYHAKNNEPMNKYGLGEDYRNLESRLRENGWNLDEDRAFLHMVTLMDDRFSNYEKFPEFVALRADLANYKVENYEQRKRMLDIARAVLDCGRNGYYYLVDVDRKPDDPEEYYRVLDRNPGGHGSGFIQSKGGDALSYAIAISENAASSNEELVERRLNAKLEKEKAEENRKDLGKLNKNTNPILAETEEEFIDHALSWYYLDPTMHTILREIHRGAIKAAKNNARLSQVFQRKMMDYPKSSVTTERELRSNFATYLRGVKEAVSKLPESAQVHFAEALTLIDRYAENIQKEGQKLDQIVDSAEKAEKSRSDEAKKRMKEEHARVSKARYAKRQRERQKEKAVTIKATMASLDRPVKEQEKEPEKETVVEQKTVLDTMYKPEEEPVVTIKATMASLDKPEPTLEELSAKIKTVDQKLIDKYNPSEEEQILQAEEEKKIQAAKEIRDAEINKLRSEMEAVDKRRAKIKENRANAEARKEEIRRRNIDRFEKENAERKQAYEEERKKALEEQKKIDEWRKQFADSDKKAAEEEAKLEPTEASLARLRRGVHVPDTREWQEGYSEFLSGNATRIWDKDFIYDEAVLKAAYLLIHFGPADEKAKRLDMVVDYLDNGSGYKSYYERAWRLGGLLEDINNGITFGDKNAKGNEHVLEAEEIFEAYTRASDRIDEMWAQKNARYKKEFEAQKKSMEESIEQSWKEREAYEKRRKEDPDFDRQEREMEAELEKDVLSLNAQSDPRQERLIARKNEADALRKDMEKHGWTEPGDAELLDALQSVYVYLSVKAYIPVESLRGTDKSNLAQSIANLTAINTALRAHESGEENSIARMFVDVSEPIIEKLEEKLEIQIKEERKQKLTEEELERCHAEMEARGWIEPEDLQFINVFAKATAEDMFAKQGRELNLPVMELNSTEKTNYRKQVRMFTQIQDAINKIPVEEQTETQKKLLEMTIAYRSRFMDALAEEERQYKLAVETRLENERIEKERERLLQEEKAWAEKAALEEKPQEELKKEENPQVVIQEDQQKDKAPVIEEEHKEEKPQEELKKEENPQEEPKKEENPQEEPKKEENPQVNVIPQNEEKKDDVADPDKNIRVADEQIIEEKKEEIKPEIIPEIIPEVKAEQLDNQVGEKAVNEIPGQQDIIDINNEEDKKDEIPVIEKNQPEVIQKDEIQVENKEVHLINPQEQDNIINPNEVDNLNEVDNPNQINEQNRINDQNPINNPNIIGEGMGEKDLSFDGGNQINIGHGMAEKDYPDEEINLNLNPNPKQEEKQNKPKVVGYTENEFNELRKGEQIYVLCGQLKGLEESLKKDFKTYESMLGKTQKNPNANFRNDAGEEGPAEYVEMINALFECKNTLENDELSINRKRNSLNEFRQRALRYRSAHKEVFRSHRSEETAERYRVIDSICDLTEVHLKLFDAIRIKLDAAAKAMQNSNNRNYTVCDRKIDDVYVMAMENLINADTDLDEKTKRGMAGIEKSKRIAEKEMLSARYGRKNGLNTPEKREALAQLSGSHSLGSYAKNYLSIKYLGELKKDLDTKEAIKLNERIREKAFEKELKVLSDDWYFARIIRKNPGNWVKKWKKIDELGERFKEDNKRIFSKNEENSLIENIREALNPNVINLNADNDNELMDNIKPFNERQADAQKIQAKFMITRALMKPENSALLHIFVNLNEKGKNIVINDVAEYLGNVRPFAERDVNNTRKAVMNRLDSGSLMTGVAHRMENFYEEVLFPALAASEASKKNEKIKINPEGYDIENNNIIENNNNIEDNNIIENNKNANSGKGTVKPKL